MAWKQIWSFASACIPSFCWLRARYSSAAMRACVGVGLVVEQALDHLERVVAPTEPDELRRREAELGHRRLGVLHARERFGQAEVREGVGRVELDDLPEDVDRLRVLALPLKARRHLVEGGERVAGQPELLVQLRELRRDVPVLVFELRGVLRDELADLLVDRDRLEREALARVELPDPLVRARWRRRTPPSSTGGRRSSAGSERRSDPPAMSFWYSIMALSYFFFSTNFWAASSTFSRSIATGRGDSESALCGRCQR